MDSYPLVSVVLSCYNHERYIVAALESIALQDWPRKELIITDDGSTDSSVSVAAAWLEGHAECFDRTELITSAKNTGITCSLNRAFAKTNGSLVKMLAADDMLRTGCLAGLVAAIEREKADIAFCYEYVFYPSEQALLGTPAESALEKRPSKTDIFHLPPEEMYKSLLRANVFPAPTAMIRKSCYDELGGFDDRYRFAEDYPFWLKALQNEKKIVFANLVGVYYRKTENSISWRAKAEPSLAQIRFQECLWRIVTELRNPELRRLGIEAAIPPEPDDTFDRLQQSPSLFFLKKRYVLSKAKKICSLLLHLPPTIFRRFKQGVQRQFNRLRDYALRTPKTRIRCFWLRLLRIFEFWHAAPVKGETHKTQSWLKLYRRAVTLEKTYASSPPSSPKKNILFAVHLLSLFSALESVYLAAMANPDWNVTLLVLPGRQPGMDNYFSYDDDLKSYLETRRYVYQMAYHDGSWHHVLEWHPDVIFYQTPYFGQRHPLYNFRYSLAGPKVCYTPYGPWVMDYTLKEYIDVSIDKPYFDGVWHIYADKLTEDILQITAPQYLPITVCTGTPKVDFYRMENAFGSYCWNFPPSPSVKRIIWMPRWGIHAGHSSFPNYYKYFLWLLRRQKNIDFVLRPHPLLFRDLVRSGYMSATQRDDMIKAFEALPNVCIDYGEDYRAGLLSCDFIISDYSSVIYEYLPSGKPLIYTRNPDTLLTPAIQAGCYCADTLDDMISLLDSLQKGEDPQVEQRMQIIENLAYFKGKMLNGEHIFNHIANHI